MKKIKLILIIDDDDISCFIASRMLEAYVEGSEIKSVNSGHDAAEYFKDPDDLYPDLILLDINMPLMNGFEFLDWYEQHGYKGKSKIAIYSSSDRREEMEKAAEYEDVIGYISKPITQGKIDEVISAFHQANNEAMTI